ncbi:MAG: DUF6709 family protein [Oscillospiraceae bacterium]
MALFRNNFRLLTTGIALFVMGIVFLVMTIGNIIDNVKTPADYAQLQIEDYREGMMVEGELISNYGSYETVTRENNGTQTTVGYYYLIDAGDEGLMGLYTPMKELISQLDQQEAETMAYFYGESDTMPRTVHCKGKVCKMDSEDVRLYRQYLDQCGFSGEDIDDFCLDLYIKVTNTSNNTPVLIVAIVVSFLGLLFVFLFIRNKMIGR